MSTRYRFCIVFILPFVTIPVPCLTQCNAQETSPPNESSLVGPSDKKLTPLELVAILRSRDEQFDNITLVAEKLWSEPVDPVSAVAAAEFATGDLPPEDRPKFPTPLPEPYTQQHRVQFRMTIRGGDITLERGAELETQMFEEFTGKGVTSLKLTSVGGGEKRYDVDSQGTSTLYVAPNANPTLEQYRTRLEFAHGFGFGKRFLEMKSVQFNADGVSCTGSFRFGDADSECELVLDKEMIVRTARIVSRSGSGQSVVNVETSGVIQSEGLPALATKGLFRRVVSSGRDETPADRTIDDDEYRFVSVTPGLTDAQYATAVAIEPKPGTRVYEAGKPIQVPLGAPVGAARGDSLWRILVINVVVIVIAFMVIAVRRLRKPG